MMGSIILQSEVQSYLGSIIPRFNLVGSIMSRFNQPGFSEPRFNEHGFNEPVTRSRASAKLVGYANEFGSQFCAIVYSKQGIVLLKYATMVG